MIGYLFLSLALFAGLSKGYCGKQTSNVAKNVSDAMLINAIRMCFCFIIGIVIIMFQKNQSILPDNPKVIWIALLSGVSTACFTVSWLLSVNKKVFMMVETFVMAGVIIPLVLSNILYSEAIGIIQILGILLLMFAVYLMCTYDKTGKVRPSFKELLLLLFCSISSGLSDFSQKVFVKELPDASIAQLNLYTYLFAALFLGITCAIYFSKLEKNAESKSSPVKLIKPIVHYILIMAVCLFLNSYFKTLAAKYLDAVLLYPLNQGCGVVFSLIMSVTLFKEKINLKGIFGIALMLVSVYIINFL